MATVVTGQVGYNKQADGAQQAPIAQGRNSELILTELHGKYYETTRRGNLWTASQAVAGVLLTLPTTTPSNGLANPPGSPKGLSLVRVELAIKVLPATPVVGYYALAVAPAVSQTVVTGTALTPVPGLVGSGGSPNGKPFTSPTLPATPLVTRQLLEKLTGAATVMPYMTGYALDFDGTCILQPGTYACVAQDAADATNATAMVTWIWEEVDL